MARLNEPPVSADSLETLRRKLLRQNRDLAKLNNVRALRIRELENECACMLSENIQLRGRVIDLEKQTEDNDARRIADHALAVKDQLETQLAQWGELIAGLGVEPPTKRHSPSTNKALQKSKPSFNANRPSPSQRRLRDVARDIEDLGSISEHKSFSRQSLNPEQILALRSEADRSGSPDLGPPPMSQFVEEEPVKIDTPPVSPAKQPEPSPKGMMGPPEELHSPIRDEYIPASPSPQKKRTDAPSRPKTTDTDSSSSSSELVPKKTSTPDLPTATPIKTGIKRKLGARGDTVNSRLTQKASNENQPLRLASGKPSIRERAEGRTLKELSSIRKGERPAVSANRKPLSAKSTNDDISSPKKAKLSASDDVATAKADMVAKGKPTATVQDRPRGRGRPPKVVEIAAPTPAPVPSSLAEVDILSPHSPPSAASAPATDENSRGGSDTPPPADISSKGETSRASRRSRGVVSYAEPNLRDKMRRPTKDMVDAVTGSRRSSQFDMLSLDASATSANSKRQSTSSAGSAPAGPEPGSIPASPLAKKGQAEEREDGGPADADLYEFKTSSPKGKGGRKKAVGRPKGSRRFSTALDEGDDDEFVPRETSSRRRSMLV